ncbi:gamma-secretase subunit pen-2-like [Nannochloropsis oceanica]
MVRTFMPQPTLEDAQVVLAKRFFFMGCLGLPWLFAVSVMYFWPKVYSGSKISSTGNSSMVRRDGGPQHGNPELRKWVGRSFAGAVLGFGILIGWVILFQLRWRGWGSGVLNYMISAPESYSSGW